MTGSISRRFQGSLPNGERTAAPSAASLAAIGGLVAANAAIAVAVGRATVLAVAIAALPILALILLWILHNRWVLVVAAVMLPLGPPLFTSSLTFGGAKISVQDMILVLAVGAWLANLGTDAPPGRTRISTRTLGWPFAFFALLVAVDTIRGHYDYGTSVLGVPLRLVLYAAIVAALVGSDTRRVYGRVTAAVYAGIVWKVATGFYYAATGGSETPSTAALSTGGQRLLSGTTSAYLAAGLFLAVLNLRHDDRRHRMPLHLTMAFLALVGIVLGFTRTTFISVGLILPLLTLRPRFLRRVAPVVPLLLPLLVLGVVLVPKVYPTAVSTFSKRISLSPKDDLSIEWRHRASAAVWEQVHESPLFGVGFGRIVYFQPPTVNGPGLIPVFEPIQQDAHNGQLWLLASGGVALLGAFWLVLVSYASDLRGRLRHATEAHEIVLVQWAGVTALSFVLNTFTSPSLGATPTLLTLWTMLLLPAAVVSRPVMRRAASLSATRTRTRRLGVLAPADSP